MNAERMDFILEEVKSKILLDFMHAIEDLTGRKPVRCLISSEQKALLDYLFAGGLYPIDEDRDYLELGQIFTEDT